MGNICKCIVLSLLPLSCMIVHKRDLTNKISSYTSEFTNQYNNTPSIMANHNSLMDVDIESPRGRTNFLSVISSREPSNHSSISSIPYVKRMEIQNDDPSWTDQVEESEQVTASQELRLSYTSQNAREPLNVPKQPIPINTPSPHVGDVSNVNPTMCSPQSINSDAIPYSSSQPIKLNS